MWNLVQTTRSMWMKQKEFTEWKWFLKRKNINELLEAIWSFRRHLLWNLCLILLICQSGIIINHVNILFPSPTLNCPIPSREICRFRFNLWWRRVALDWRSLSQCQDSTINDWTIDDNLFVLDVYRLCNGCFVGYREGLFLITIVQYTFVDKHCLSYVVI